MSIVHKKPAEEPDNFIGTATSVLALSAVLLLKLRCVQYLTGVAEARNVATIDWERLVT